MSIELDYFENSQRRQTTQQTHMTLNAENVLDLCSRLLPHVLLCVFVVFMFIPLYLALVAASHSGAAMMQAPLP